MTNFFRGLSEFYQRYRAYIRVDLVMYGCLLLLIILYIICTALAG